MLNEISQKDKYDMISFPFDIYPEEGPLGHMASLFLMYFYIIII